MQRTHVTVCAVGSACVTITEGFIPPILYLFRFFLMYLANKNVRNDHESTVRHNMFKLLLNHVSPTTMSDIWCPLTQECQNYGRGPTAARGPFCIGPQQMIKV